MVAIPATVATGGRRQSHRTPDPDQGGAVAKSADSNHQLLRLLGDGEFHSGEHLAAVLGLSRAAIWKRLRLLREKGLPLVPVRGRGYRLARAIEPLDADRICAGLAAAGLAGQLRVEVLFEIGSTNSFVLEQMPLHGHMAVAEYQTAGRGRRGNRWLAPLGGSICLSLGWRLDPTPVSVNLLSLLAAAAVIRTLAASGVEDAGVKWPNDLVVGSGKLGGILIESRAQGGGPTDVVVGIGLNVDLGGELAIPGGTRAVDLCGILGETPSRNAVIVRLLVELVGMLRACQNDAVHEYLELWRRHDVARGRQARLILPNREVSGRVVDIDDDGLLRMDINGEVSSFSSGELSLRIE